MCTRALGAWGQIQFGMLYHGMFREERREGFGRASCYGGCFVSAVGVPVGGGCFVSAVGVPVGVELCSIPCVALCAPRNLALRAVVAVFILNLVSKDFECAFYYAYGSF